MDIYPDEIPAEIQALESFLIWKNISKEDGKMTKSPVSSAGFPTAHNDPDVLIPFELAKESLSKASDLGLGISLLDGVKVNVGAHTGYLWCLDFDGFAEPNSDKVDDGVLSFVESFPSYTEISPSGTGFKYFFVCDRLPQSKSKIKFGPSEFAEKYPNITKYARREIEVFSRSFYLALTGQVFSPSTAEIKFVSSTELENLLEHLNSWAKSTGGSGTTASSNAGQKSISTTPNTSYSKLTKPSLEVVLACVDHVDEQIWSDTANLLARVYGEDGRSYFQSYSKGDYCGVAYDGYTESGCEARFDRALNELKYQPDGYGISHLLSLARTHPNWPNRKLEYESNFGFSAISSTECIANSDKSLSTSEQVEKIPSSIERMDIRNGERFREHFCGTLCFVRDTGDVLNFDADRGWTRGNSDLPMQAAKEVVAKMTEACAVAIREGKDAKCMLADVKRSSSRRALEDMIKLARSEPGMSVALSALDNNPYLLGVQNGVVDLKKGTLLSPDPNLLVTKYCNIIFDSEAKCPQFFAFLEQVVPIKEQRDFLVIVLGYFLTGLSTEQLWFFFHGVGSNGKSVLITLLENLMGDYATKIPTEMLMQHNRSSAGAAPDLLLLQGKQLVFCNETKEGQRLDDARLKDLTGNDTIIGRPLYSNNHISFAPTHKLVVVGNYHPTVSDDSHGFWRRVVLYPFSVTIPQAQQDKRLLGKLIAEGPGILNYLLDALKTYFEKGLEVPKSLSQATQQYRTEQDMVQQFLDDECVTAPDKTITKQTLYLKYTLWCSANGLYGLSTNRLSRKLTAKGFKLREDKRTWVGVGPPTDICSGALMR
jgi:P4 family phage/plasmid primase-like protien